MMLPFYTFYICITVERCIPETLISKHLYHTSILTYLESTQCNTQSYVCIYIYMSLYIYLCVCACSFG